MFATPVTSGWNALSAPPLFVSVGVSVGLEEPLRWRGVNTHAARACVRRSRRQAERQTGPIATALDWGSAAHWTRARRRRYERGHEHARTRPRRQSACERTEALRFLGVNNIPVPVPQQPGEEEAF